MSRQLIICTYNVLAVLSGYCAVSFVNTSVDKRTQITQIAASMRNGTQTTIHKTAFC